ncbi:MAG: tRNA 4-thiouridine(8) synthase ThiI [Candidatus Altiarchaeales archaeon ex4484_2]|nr:MAG: tRNA 4-thiouridine(8) synthase ThiI [Candidatus Altiarchaeales archaeon ex4484_2]
MYDTIIVRYSEIFLKSEYVKKEFENQLIGNIQLKLKGLEVGTRRDRHRIYLKTKKASSLASEVARVYGVKSVSPAIEIDSGIENLSARALELAKEVIEDGEGFAVRARRNNYSLKSREIEARLGEIILEKIDCHVNLDNPDKTIHVEVRGNQAYIFHEKIRGVGGLPYKTQGKVIALISEGIDSPVAAWMLMKRGCEVIAVHYGSDTKVRKVLGKLEEYSVHGIRLYLIPYKEILEKIKYKSGRNMCIVCKRLMYRIAEEIALRENAEGLVTGENIGQVASQTLHNLTLLDESVSMPVYRPLVGMDKEEIISKAREIGTYMLIKPQRCEFAPTKPSTKAKKDEIREIEQELEIDELVKKVLGECGIK